MKNIKILITKYYSFGLIFLFIFYVVIGEIPSWHTIERDWVEWITTIISIPLIIGLLAFKYLNRYVRIENQKYFGISFFILFASWILILYFKALVIGIINSFEFERIQILESLLGYSIYQLWIYGIFGIIHGIVGGYFLSKELKNNEEKHEFLCFIKITVRFYTKLIINKKSC
ncbi:hypothetical protein [Neotamlana laminarinivorans]|uniref:Uncharacterized protein n=1 Tax=Neotamlana laminarinivorans TaxID=2883124 RepID=A0A9X1L284_9FLAO|nr:hypothetical protein [Tamlana laminarinivorans]MCB4797369.1 hypothetical protein [Tamlana laminarinivorans]